MLAVAPSLTWSFEPLQTVPTVLIALLYWRRTRTLARSGRPVPPWRRAAFWTGIGLVVVALNSPVDRLGEVELEATGRLITGGLTVHEDDGSCSEEERDEDLVQVAAQKPGGRPDVLEAERLDDP